MATAAPKYTLTKIRTFTGMEGYGLNATICKDGKPVAFVLDEANGGEIRIDFTNPGQNAASYKAHLERAGAEESECGAWCLDWFRNSPDAAASRKLHAEICGTEEPTEGGAIEDWVNATVDSIQTKKRMDRLAKKKTLFRVEGDQPDEYRTLKAPYSPAVQEWLDKKYPGKVVEIWGVRAAS